MEDIKIVLSIERKINMKDKECITKEISDKILSIIKEYKITYRDALDIFYHLRRKLEDTVISDDSLKSE